MLLAAALLAMPGSKTPEKETQHGNSSALSNSPILRLLFVAMLILIGTLLTRNASYIALIGGALFFVSLFNFVPAAISKFLFKLGGIAFLVGNAVIGSKLFMSPSDSETRIEDRTDHVAPEDTNKSPSELLALKWSSNDEISHWPVAKLMLDLCVIAYKDPSEARLELAELGIESETVNGGSMIGYVVDFGDDAVVVFRGTETDDEYDILQDLRFIRRGGTEGGMHGGFKRGYDSLHSQVATLLERYETKRVWITGHSLGGGLAVCCAQRLLKDGHYELAGMMTFGQPMAVDPTMRKWLTPRLEGKYVFFVNDMDLVTRFVEPYVHCGEMVHWTGEDIERSKLLTLMSTGPGQDPLDDARLYLESKSNADLDALIDQLERNAEPTRDQDGRIVARGGVPSGFDHQLKNYAKMLDLLRTHRQASEDEK